MSDALLDRVDRGFMYMRRIRQRPAVAKHGVVAYLLTIGAYLLTAAGIVVPNPPWQFTLLVALFGILVALLPVVMSRVNGTGLAHEVRDIGAGMLAVYVVMPRGIAKLLLGWVILAPARWSERTSPLRYQRVLRLFGLLLGKQSRERVYEPAAEELLRDYMDARRDHRTKWARRWIVWVFFVKTVALWSGTVRVAAWELTRTAVWPRRRSP